MLAEKRGTYSARSRTTAKPLGAPVIRTQPFCNSPVGWLSLSAIDDRPGKRANRCWPSLPVRRRSAMPDRFPRLRRRGADEDGRRQPRRRGAQRARGQREADQVRGHRRAAGGAGALLPGPPRRPHPRHGCASPSLGLLRCSCCMRGATAIMHAAPSGLRQLCTQPDWAMMLSVADAFRSRRTSVCSLPRSCNAQRCYTQ